MAETHHKPGIATPTTHCYTVGYVSDAKYRPVPAITLKGHWLEEAGFGTETPVNVWMMQDCLILTVKQPSSDPEVLQALPKTPGS